MSDCVFCQIARGEAPSWGVHEDESTYAFLNIFPATKWHTLVVPKVHHVDVFDTPVEELVAVSRAVKLVVDLREAGAARARRRGKDADLDDLLRGVPY